MGMLKRHEYKKLTWISLESPTAAEITEVAREYKLNPLVAEDLANPSLKPKADLYKNHIYLILHFPSRRRNHVSESLKNEVDFVLGKNFVITTTYDNIEPLESFSKAFEVNSILDKSEMGDHAGFIFFYMAKKLYRAMGNDLEYIKNALYVAEDRIFKGEERTMVEVLSKLGRELLDFRQTIKPHQEVLKSLETAGKQFYGADFAYHLESITGEYYKVCGAIESNKEFLKELRDTNDSLLTTKQNETMKLFTILAFVTFPLSLAIEILTIPSASNPIAGHPYAFWIIVGLTLASCVLMFLFFKHKKWL
jgi:magnesium transporter